MAPPRRARAGRGRKASDGRIRLLRFALLAAFVVVAGKAVALTSSSPDLSALAARQHLRTVALPAHRGAMLDRSGQELAIGREQRTVYATPSLLKQPAAAARELAKVLHLKRKPLQRLLSDRDSGFAYVARKADPQLAQQAVALRIPGVGSYPEEERVYPLKTVAAQVLGFAGTENKGLAGLEYEYDRQLSGRAGGEVVVRDPTGRVLRTARAKDPLPGEDLRLTIDEEIQSWAERILADTVRVQSAKSGTAIVMDSRTGEVLALANAPLIDANKYGQDPARARNRAVTDAYEPGSIFKVVTVSAALAEGLVRPNTKLVLPPTITVGGKVIHEAHPRGTQVFTVHRILAESSNVGAATLGIKLGKERLLKWIDLFGFGRPTGLAFPGEVGGIVPGYWSESTIGNVPMGQGISATPMQIACAYAAIANGGVWHTPRLVAQVGHDVVQPEAGRRVVSQPVARQVVKMMSEAVEDGTGTAFQIPGYRTAGKTGTAEKPDPRHGGYAKGKYVASFVGIVPADHPSLIVVVMVDEPQGQIWGAAVAAPAAQKIAVFALQHLKIAP